MNTQPNTAQWNALQALVEAAIPEENWMLHRLETGVETVSGGEVVQVVLERVRRDHTADQVVGSGETAEAAVRAAIHLALRYPELPEENERDRDRFDGIGDPWDTRDDT